MSKCLTSRTSTSCSRRAPRSGNILSEKSVSPNLAVCVRYTDILLYDKLRQETGILMNRTSDYRGIVQSQSMLTVRQIFDYTPAAESWIASAKIRKNDSFLLKRCEQRECDSQFDLSKFYLQEYVCYRMQFRQRNVIDMDMTAFALRSSHVLYYVYLSDAMSGADCIRVIAHTDDHLPHQSKDFAPTVDRLSDFDSKTIHSNSFSFSFITSEIQLMQWPYDSDCEPDTNRSIAMQHHCMLHKLSVVHRVPFTGILSERHDLKHLSYQDLENKTMADFVIRSENECANVFRKLDCRFSFTITTLVQSTRSHDERKFLLKMRIPSSPGIQVIMDAKVTLSEYLIFVGSCFGIWFGLSAFSLNPVKFIKSVRYVNDGTESFRW